MNEEESKMECPKCSGLMYMERLTDFFVIFNVWKCINCGALMDKTIIENHQKSLDALEAVGSASG